MSPQLRLQAQPASVARARRFVRAALQSLGAQAVLDDAELLVSELATNAVLHARSAFVVEVSRNADRVRICVVDSSPAAPRVRSFGAEATTGRGLQLVQTLSVAWGVERRPVGKTIWVELLAAGRPAPRPLPDDAGPEDVEALLASFSDDPDSPTVRAA